MMSSDGRRWQAGMLLALAAAAFVLVAAFSARRVEQASAKGLAEKGQKAFERALDNPGGLNVGDREEPKGKWRRFSLETRGDVVRAMLRRSVENFRRETAKLPKEKRIARMREEAERLRRDRERAIAEDREGAASAFAGTDVNKLVEEALAACGEETDAQERAEFDPLVHEYVYQLDRIAR